jgi:hypothetical protein
MKVGIINELKYTNKQKIKDIIFELKRKYGSLVEIVSRGGNTPTDKYIKKCALEFGLQYKEFNPAHSTHNLYSAMNESFYNKPYRAFNFILRDKIFSKYVDVCFCMTENVDDPSVRTCIKQLEKNDKKFVVLS